MSKDLKEIMFHAYELIRTEENNIGKKRLYTILFKKSNIDNIVYMSYAVPKSGLDFFNKKEGNRIATERMNKLIDTDISNKVYVDINKVNKVLPLVIASTIDRYAGKAKRALDIEHMHLIFRSDKRKRNEYFEQDMTAEERVLICDMYYGNNI